MVECQSLQYSKIGGGKKMRYQIPEMEVVQYEHNDLILCSDGSFESGETGTDSNTGGVKPPYSWAP